MISDNDLSAYLKRIEYTGTLKPDLDTLTILHEHHIAHIPFENLNPFLGLPVKLDHASLQQKLVNDQRGGYCFENNGLYRWMLEKIGFEVRPMAGRVMWNSAEDVITRKTHMILLVHIEGKDYLEDVGFGGFVEPAPLLFQPGIIQETKYEPYKLEKNGDTYTLRVLVSGQWRLMYRFITNPVPQVDYEVANWFTATNPECSFVTGISVSRIDNGRRYTLNNNIFKIRLGDNQDEKHTLNTVSEMKDILENIMHIKLPDYPNLESRFSEILLKNEKTNPA